MTTRDQVEVLDVVLGSGCTFAAYRLPGGPLRIVAQHRAALHQVDLKAEELVKDSFVIVPFDRSGSRISYISPDVPCHDPLQVSRDLEACESSVPSPGPRVIRDDPAVHQAIVQQAIEAIAAGGLRKVVLARSTCEDLPEKAIPALFFSFLEQYPSAFVCMVRTPEHGLWCGASPERLMHFRGNELYVDSIAGTLPLDRAPLHAEAWDEKERDEQDLVTQHVERILATIGPVRTIGPNVLPAGPVAHLHTVCTTRTDLRTATSVLEKLHPTPAVCGTPRRAARAFIEQHEPLDRGLYAGFWGPWHGDRGIDLYVNIRCARLFHGRAELFVGGGITAASRPEREWSETERKAATWRGVIASLSSSRIS
ncbi:MAG: chorismate-binding protein [Flavobacteriales bacterium]|nr:chorismate-binding protein [Flavobacteriales bacterium]